MRLTMIVLLAGLVAAPAFAQEHDTPACLATDAALPAGLGFGLN